MTPSPQSYRPGRHGGGVEGASDRLDAQIRLTWPSERRILRDTERTTPDTIVELGCGTGSLLAKMRAEWPDADLIGVDNDAELMSRATHLRDVSLLRADVNSVPLPDASADLVVLRYVLQHLGETGPTLGEALRILKPGGRCVVFEVDGGLWGLAEPYIPEVQRLQARIWAAQADRGGDRMIGRRVRRMCLEAGFAEAELELYQYSSDMFGLDAFGPLLDPAQHVDLVEDGVLSPGELARASVAYSQWLRDPRSFVMMVGFAVTAIRRSDDWPMIGIGPLG